LQTHRYHCVFGDKVLWRWFPLSDFLHRLELSFHFGKLLSEVLGAFGSTRWTLSDSTRLELNCHSVRSQVFKVNRSCKFVRLSRLRRTLNHINNTQSRRLSHLNSILIFLLSSYPDNLLIRVSLNISSHI